MKYNKILYVFILIFISCYREQPIIETTKIQEFLETKELKIDVKNNTPKSIYLTATNPKILYNDNYYPEFASSITALQLYNIMNDEQKLKFDSVIVVFEVDTNNFNINNKYQYSFNDIKKIVDYTTTIDNFFNNIISNYPASYSMLGKEITNNIPYDTLKTRILQIFVNSNPVTNNKLLGFTVKKDKIGIIQNVYFDSNYVTYAFTFHKYKHEKIIGIFPYEEYLKDSK